MTQVLITKQCFHFNKLKPNSKGQLNILKTHILLLVLMVTVLLRITYIAKSSYKHLIQLDWMLQLTESKPFKTNVQ